MQKFVIRAWLVCEVFMGLLAAAPEPASGQPQEPSAAADEIRKLISQLSHDREPVRKQATAKLWAIGRPALSLLKAQVHSSDPELAWRARDLVERIEFGFTPDTDPKCIKLAARYPRAPRDRKIEILIQLREDQFWRTALVLFGRETAQELREHMDDFVCDMAIHASRFELLQGDPSAARELLELAPQNHRMRMALAEFHRTHGDLEQELQRIGGRQEEPDAAAWRLALLLAKGDLAAAREAARRADLPQVQAMIAAIQRDPLPLLTEAAASSTPKHPFTASYAQLATQRWQGEPMDAALVQGLKEATNEPNTHRSLAREALTLLGLGNSVLPSLTKDAPSDAFELHLAYHQTEEALAVLGLTPDSVQQPEWVNRRISEWFELLMQDPQDRQVKGIDPMQQLIMRATFMERYGMQRELVAFYTPPMLDLAKRDTEQFLVLLESLVAHSAVIAREVGAAWAGDDEERWEALAETIFGDYEIANWWAWMPELMPAVSREQHWNAAFCLLQRGPDPEGLGRQCMSRAWELHEQAKGARRVEILERIYAMAHTIGDSTHSMRAGDALDPAKRDNINLYTQTSHLVAAGRWQQAADVAQTHLEPPVIRLDSNDFIHTMAFIAAALRHAGKEKQAAEQDSIIDRVVLGDPNAAIEAAEGYERGRDHARARQWAGKALRFAMAAPDAFGRSARQWIELESAEAHPNWPQLAALAEINCLIYSQNDDDYDWAQISRSARMQADLYRAVSLWPENPKHALLLLDTLHTRHLGDSGIADAFFPALRKAGIEDIDQRWFAASWQAINETIETYPRSVEARNHAARLAIGAQTHLKQAEALLAPVLKQSPVRGEDLVTMAALKLALGNDAQAISLAQQALNQNLDDQNLLRLINQFLPVEKIEHK